MFSRHLMLAAGQLGCMPMASLSTDCASLALDSSAPYPPMRTETSLRPDKCSTPPKAAPCCSHPRALNATSSLWSLGIAPAANVRYDVQRQVTSKCLRARNPVPQMVTLSLGVPKMYTFRWMRECNCAMIPTSSSNTSLTPSARS
uniref:Uncharacterized protein n=1 Tax=Triticum urartu TaxID=4572 RepID=A0A8R7UMW5_TRIUA